VSNQTRHDHDVVITGLGTVTALGVGWDAQWAAMTQDSGAALGRSLQEFQAAPHVTDRRMLKQVSKADAIGLAGIENLCKAIDYKQGAVAADRIGLYVGAPPASAFDNEPYMDAQQAARDSYGRPSVRAFGKTCMSSRPTTLLVGLPNNVLCYGALVLDAKGPNSNYTGGMLSAHVALTNAAKRVRRGQCDLAIAGGFASHLEPVNSRIYAELCPGMDLADGATFVTVERRADAAKVGRKPIVSFVASSQTSDAMGPTLFATSGDGIERAVGSALALAGLTPDDIGLMLADLSGIASLDAGEFTALSRVFAKARALPALGYSSGVTGNLMEAGGLLELKLVQALYRLGQVPQALRAQAAEAQSFATTVDRASEYAVILRVSPWGEYSCVIVRYEDQQ
jgi:3-oxoacyl-(acyl-carrier-protein) synthase